MKSQFGSSALLFILISLTYPIEALKVQVVTWNVLSNKWMDHQFDTATVEKLLSPITGNKTTDNADIVAVTVQENCFFCNQRNHHMLADVFRNTLNRIFSDVYDVIGMETTRTSNFCEGFLCRNIHHGTTAAILIAKTNLLHKIGTHRVNKCTDAFIKNAEKGIAGVEAEVKSSGKRICFAGLHLDSDKSSARRDCVARFWRSRPASLWQRCDTIIFAGDFNTRTGPKDTQFFAICPRYVSVTQLGLKYFTDRAQNDEMRGSKPFGGMALLSYISSVTGRNFSEQPVTFLPTYSIRPNEDCCGEAPCFRHNRPPSWADRIVYYGARKIAYTSFVIAESDHNPVVAEFEI